ncbi:AlpA family transcriptional regulator [Roseovarius sp. EL26]|uniref:helix-turn-helix transcriptional regulator n=1 Tax=Roseovarius sp. EL26 TaxID=2126672 RepID=UPI000EA1657F|nr:AlpA family transcriptional regulator [Roseovarius sp. EL26]
MLSETSEDRLLNREEVEERFGIPKRFLETAITRDNGPRRVRIGRLVKYRVKDVSDWIEANTSPGVDQ